MKKITSKIEDLHGKKSLRDILEIPKNVESSCSLKTERSELPSIKENKKTENNRRPKQKENSNESLSEIFWLKPGISLPKMRESKKPKPALPVTSSSEISGDDITISLPSGSATVSSHTLGGYFLDNIITEEIRENIIGPSECQSSFEVVNSDINNHTVYLDDPVSEESKSLRNWEKWMTVWRKQNDRFSAKIKRDKCQLVMNSADDVRQIREEKDLMTYARIETPDKWRGHPSFWKDPAALSRKGMKNKYYAYKTMSERGMVPTLEFVSVPDTVKIEKDVFCGNQRSRNAWGKSEYREDQRKKYAKYLDKIAPHNIEARDLIVVGKKIRPDDKNLHSEGKEVPVIQVTPPEEVVPSETEDSVVMLVINGTEIKMHENETEMKESFAWSLMFEIVQTGIVTEKVLCVENKGTVAVQYKWVYKNPDKQISFPGRKATMSEPCFFFDKNPGIFLPGQIKQLKFYHHSKIPGYHSQTWSLKLDPKLYENGTVMLTAIAENGNTVEDFLKIDAYLDSCVASFVVRQIVDEIFERAEPELPTPIEYHSLFMEEELFEFQNPAHYYRYDVVEELKSVYRQVSLDGPEEWDLNLFTLEGLIRTYVTGRSRREMLCKFTEMTRMLLRPGPRFYNLNKKHQMLYNVLCGIVDSMETRIQRIRDDFAKLDSLYDDQEGEIIPDNSLKSEGSQVSTSSIFSKSEDRGTSDKFVFRISCENLFYYRFALYITFFNCLREAAEQAAGIIESCHLFEHHGEVIAAENCNFIFQ